MGNTYTVYSDFDIQKHKKTFINYLEVLILEDGSIKYAVPSHQMLAEELCITKLNITRDELYLMTLNHLGDYMEWLLTQTNSIALWSDGYIAGDNGANAKQLATLRKLKMNGLYKGKMPLNNKNIDVFKGVVYGA